MSRSRDDVMARVRKALGKVGRDERGLASAEAYLAQHAQGPRPAQAGDLVERFMRRARDMESTVERIADRSEIPAQVARYLGAAQLSLASSEQTANEGVCWPELAALDWIGAGLKIEARPAIGSDRLGITGVFCAIAETGTMVILSGAETPTATMLLPETHVAVVRADRIVPGMEDAFALIRRERGELPRAVNLISGPSRTGDIEQTIVLGAHGPYRVHILVVSSC